MLRLFTLNYLVFPDGVRAFLVVIKTTNLTNQPGEGDEENGSSEANDGPSEDFSAGDVLQLKSPEKFLELVCFL
ncbi:unnamed protein product [Ixodes persulcatus]